MKILFLDQSGQLGGAELCLLDIAKTYRDRSLVGLFSDGPFKAQLQHQQIPVQVLTEHAIAFRKENDWLQGIASLGSVLPLIFRVARLSLPYDLIYANTQKALVVAALASVLSRRPLVYHLHDILSLEHFSATNRRLIVGLANRFAARIIANSQASRDAFVAAGGRTDLVTVIYNGFEPARYQSSEPQLNSLRTELGWQNRFLVGHFSRLAPWKGQHVLLQALALLPDHISAIVVGDALFGEHDYSQRLQALVEDLGLGDRVHFTGFRSDVIPLMHTCDLITHTSVAPEPFGRVIAEAMLCGKPVIATGVGGAAELIEPDVSGWLVSPDHPDQLAAAIAHASSHPEQAQTIAQRARHQAHQLCHAHQINQQIEELLQHVQVDQRNLASKPLWELEL